MIPHKPGRWSAHWRDCYGEIIFNTNEFPVESMTIMSPATLDYGFSLVLAFSHMHSGSAFSAFFPCHGHGGLSNRRRVLSRRPARVDFHWTSLGHGVNVLSRVEGGLLRCHYRCRMSWNQMTLILSCFLRRVEVCGKYSTLYILVSSSSSLTLYAWL